jgi:pimeloyl-ACP methyl ester carboxylesterase
VRDYSRIDLRIRLTHHRAAPLKQLRGAGLSGHPYAEKGYLSATVAEDLVQLLDALEVEKAYVHGENRGAEYGFVLAARHPERVHQI